MENRGDPRFVFLMKAAAISPPSDATFTAENVSSTGIYFLGDPHVAEGTAVWLRLDYTPGGRKEHGSNPLCAEVQVVRVSLDSNRSIIGFGGRWLNIISIEGIDPLRSFLRGVLSISGGVVETLGKGEQVTGYRYTFPKPETATPKAPVGNKGALESPDDRTPIDYLKGDQARGYRTQSALYIMLPIRYLAGNSENEGRAIKLMSDAMRVSTMGPLPTPYSKTSIRIDSESKGTTLDLHGTVVMTRPMDQKSAEGRFEVKFSLGNSPEALNGYRNLLERLADAIPLE